MDKCDKTNVMRILERENIEYEPISYDASATDGITIAALLGENCSRVFKTLVTIASDRKNYVFDIPVDKKLDLKKAAKAVGVKSLDMLKQKDLFPLTGYVHGGCSPIGMKKPFPTVFDVSCCDKPRLCVSGGKIGKQVRLYTHNLLALVGATVADITVSE